VPAGDPFDAWRWVWDPEWIAAIVLFGAWYAWLSHVEHVRPARRLAFAAGLLLIAAALLSPIEHLALHAMVSFHLLQNVMLADWAPPLLVLGFPAALAARGDRLRAWRALTSPGVAICLWLAVWYVVHVPAVYEAALRHRAVLGIEHLAFLVAGLAFWWPVLVPGRMRPGPRVVYLCAGFFFASPLALLIALSNSTVYGFYDTTPHLWDLTPHEDQSLGGMLMAIEQSLILFAAAFSAFIQLLREDDSAGDAVGSAS
jgi:cytochrome c oxidase assembly factor CtaG